MIYLMIGLMVFPLYLILNTLGVIKYKAINSKEQAFIKRLTIYLPKGSIKIHLILSDDKDEPHDHPWNFTSFLLLPYKEELYETDRCIIGKVSRKWTNHYGIFKLIRRTYTQKHRVKLYTIKDIKIPALTIGYYSEKKQLCSFCRELGYCKENITNIEIIET